MIDNLQMQKENGKQQQQNKTKQKQKQNQKQTKKKTILLKVKKSLLVSDLLTEMNGRGGIFTKILRGCACWTWKIFDFLYSNFVLNFSPISSIPFSIENHPILSKSDAFCNNLLKIHPIIEFGRLHL